MFEFTGLPAGAYRVFASSGQYSAAYLGTAFGSTRPMIPGGMQDPGTPIQLAEGQRFDKATIALPRGSVLTGRVSDENGEPMARVQVYTMFLPGASGRPMRTGSSASTDDLGQFRLFGLPPGDYFVVAEARGPTFVPPNSTPTESEDDNIGFMTTYFPGTADETSAQRVRARLGSETPGVEIRMVSGRLFRISGTITNSQGQASSRTSGQLTRGTPGGAMTSMGFSTDEQGRFQMRNIAPGNYRLIVRGPRAATPNAPNQGGGDAGEMAIVPVAISADLEGIVIVTGPGATVTGQITFEQGPPQAAPGQNAPNLRVTAQIADPQNAGPVPTPQPAVVGADYTFALKGMMGEFLLRASAPGQTLKAVMLGAQDITDTPREFKNGERVTLVMTSAVSSIEGTVTDTKGTPASEASILIFSEDRASWRPNSLRTRRGSTDASGHFRISGLVPGRYHAIAAPRDVINVPTMMQDAAFFEALSKEATTFVVGEGEQRQVDLKLVASIGG
jgi:protocatechuate 3,4-dioxygenase beta subunit